MDVIFIEKSIEPLKYDKLRNHNFIFCMFLFIMIKWKRVEEKNCPYVVVLCQLIHLYWETIRYRVYFNSLTCSSAEIVHL